MSDVVEARDADLITAVRAGDVPAFGTLFDRHRDAANRLARQLAPGPDADDLVAEAFTRVLTLLQDGKGPDEAFRAYLLTTVRRLHVDRFRRSSRERSTGDDDDLDREIAFVDPAERAFESGTAAAAFGTLPERWQTVLWHLEVEGDTPAQVAVLLGMSPNSVSALAYRAREGLRQAYLQGHINDEVDAGCRSCRSRLGGYVRHGLSRRDSAAVETHLDSCRACTGIYLELNQVNRDLGAILAPQVLGVAASGYLTGAAAAAGAGAATATATGVTAAGTSGAISTGTAGVGAATTAGVTTASSVGTGAATAGAVSAGAVSATAAGAGTAATVGAAAGAKAVLSTVVHAVIVPVKAVAAVAVSATPQTVVAATVVTGVATAGVVVATDSTPPPAPPPVVATAPPSATTDPTALPTPTPTPTVEESPTPDPTVPPAPVVEPPPPATPAPQQTPTDEPATTTPTPTPTPEPPPPPGTTDFSVGPVASTNEPRLLQRRITVPVVATAEPNPVARAVTVRIDFQRPVRFRGVDPGWTCDAAARSRIRTITCTATLPPGQGGSLSIHVAGLRPSGTVTVSGAGDPVAANDAATFRARPWLLSLLL